LTGRHDDIDPVKRETRVFAPYGAGIQPPARPQEDARLDEPPAGLVDWVRAVRTIPQLEDSNPIVVPMSGMAKSLFRQFMHYIRDHANELRKDPAKGLLADLWARTHEHALKLALMVAVGKASPDEMPKSLGDSTIEVDLTSAEWAIDYVRHYTLEMEREMGSKVGVSELDRAAKDVVRLIRNAGILGLTIAELNKRSRSFEDLADLRQQRGLLDLARAREEVVMTETRAANGRRRQAYVAIEFADEIEASLLATDPAGTTGT